MDLYTLIRDIPDFPQKGIVYKDITPLLKDAAGFAEAVDAMAAPFANERIDAVVAVEARGYILGAPLALKLNAGFVPVRKLGKLPFDTHKVEYLLEYGSDTIEIHQDGLESGHRVLIVDDILATGGTLEATVNLVQGTGAEIAGMALLAEIGGLGGRDRLKGRRLEVVLTL
jgi:adenine phosphoribosyltransferase